MQRRDGRASFDHGSNASSANERLRQFQFPRTNQMKPIKISPRITLQLDTQARVESKADIQPVEVFVAVENWIQNNPQHPRCGDAEVWLNAFVQQNPNVRPPTPKPLSKDRLEKIKWSEER